MLAEMKRSKTVGIATASAMMLAVLVVSLMSPVAYAAEIPEDAEIEDHGDFWGFTMNFIFAGSDAETIEWDFGDGSVSNDWNPQHTYEAIGEYIVTQTVWNSYEGGSTSTGYYRINLLGAPYVEFIQPEGAPAMDRVYAYLDGDTTEQHRTITQPSEDPVWEGHEFIGYFADPEYTVLFDWDVKLWEPVDVYIGWSGYAPIYHILTIKDSDGDVVTTLNVQDGVAASVPVPPVGKIATYYIDSDLTEEYDWSTVITEDVTIYRVLEDEPVVVPDEPSGYIINGTILILGGAGLLFLIIGFATRRPGALIFAILLMAVAVIGVLDVIEIPEILKNFEGYEIPKITEIFKR